MKSPLLPYHVENVRRSPRKKPQKSAERGKRKLDFNKDGQSKKPLHGWKVFIDVNSNTKTQEIRKRVISLGGTVENFLSKDIKLLITGQREVLKSDGLGNADPSPLSYGPSPSPLLSTRRSLTQGLSPYSNEFSPFNSVDKKQKPQIVTRGKSLVDRALITKRGAGNANSVVKAKQFGAKVLTADDFYKKYMRKHKDDDNVNLTSLKTNKNSVQMLKSNRTRQLSSTQVLKLRESFFKIEDKSKLFRPVVFEMKKKWPKLHFQSCQVQSPFELVKELERSVEKGKTCAEAEVDDELTKSLSDQSEEEENEIEEKTQETQEELKKLATTKHKSQQQTKPGYCDCCSTKYTDLKQHLKSEQHRSFASNENHFKDLDKLINQVTSFNTFVESLKEQALLKKKQEIVEMESPPDLVNRKCFLGFLANGDGSFCDPETCDSPLHEISKIKDFSFTKPTDDQNDDQLNDDLVLKPQSRNDDENQNTESVSVNLISNLNNDEVFLSPMKKVIFNPSLTKTPTKEDVDTLEIKTKANVISNPSLTKTPTKKDVDTTVVEVKTPTSKVEQLDTMLLIETCHVLVEKDIPNDTGNEGKENKNDFSMNLHMKCMSTPCDEKPKRKPYTNENLNENINENINEKYPNDKDEVVVESMLYNQSSRRRTRSGCHSNQHQYADGQQNLQQNEEKTIKRRNRKTSDTSSSSKRTRRSSTHRSSQCDSQNDLPKPVEVLKYDSDDKISEVITRPSPLIRKSSEFSSKRSRRSSTRRSSQSTQSDHQTKEVMKDLPKPVNCDHEKKSEVFRINGEPSPLIRKTRHSSQSSQSDHQTEVHDLPKPDMISEVTTRPSPLIRKTRRKNSRRQKNRQMSLSQTSQTSSQVFDVQSEKNDELEFQEIILNEPTEHDTSKLDQSDCLVSPQRKDSQTINESTSQTNHSSKMLIIETLDEEVTFNLNVDWLKDLPFDERLKIMEQANHATSRNVNDGTLQLFESYTIDTISSLSKQGEQTHKELVDYLKQDEHEEVKTTTISSEFNNKTPCTITSDNKTTLAKQGKLEKKHSSDGVKKVETTSEFNNLLSDVIKPCVITPDNEIPCAMKQDKIERKRSSNFEEEVETTSDNKTPCAIISDAKTPLGSIPGGGFTSNTFVTPYQHSNIHHLFAESSSSHKKCFKGYLENGDTVYCNPQNCSDEKHKTVLFSDDDNDEDVFDVTHEVINEKQKEVKTGDRVISTTLQPATFDDDDEVDDVTKLVLKGSTPKRDKKKRKTRRNKGKFEDAYSPQKVDVEKQDDVKKRKITPLQRERKRSRNNSSSSCVSQNVSDFAIEKNPIDRKNMSKASKSQLCTVVTSQEYLDEVKVNDGIPQDYLETIGEPFASRLYDRIKERRRQQQEKEEEKNRQNSSRNETLKKYKPNQTKDNHTEQHSKKMRSSISYESDSSVNRTSSKSYKRRESPRKTTPLNNTLTENTRRSPRKTKSSNDIVTENTRRSPRKHASTHTSRRKEKKLCKTSTPFSKPKSSKEFNNIPDNLKDSFEFDDEREDQPSTSLKRIKTKTTSNGSKPTQRKYSFTEYYNLNEDVFDYVDDNNDNDDDDDDYKPKKRKTERKKRYSFQP